mgnify:CR=1 FL=1
MSKVEHPLHALKAYLPEGAFEPVLALIHQYKLHLTVTKARKSVLGDYRHPKMGANHKISVNGNLNQFEFVVLLKYKRLVQYFVLLLFPFQYSLLISLFFHTTIMHLVILIH